MKAKLFTYAPRLIAMLQRPGGVTVEEATRAADANLTTIRRQSLAELDRVIARMQAMGETLTARPSAEQTGKLYALASTVTGIAGAFTLTRVQAAACSLCELLDELNGQGRWNFEAVEVHLHGLQKLHAPEPGATDEDLDRVLSGLAEVVKAVNAGRA